MKRRVPILVLAASTLTALLIAGAFFIFSGGDADRTVSGNDSSGALESSSSKSAEAGQEPPAGITTGIPATGGQTAGDGEVGRQLSGSPSKSSPKLQSSISEIAAVQVEKGPEAAAGYAADNGLVLEDGKVKVVLEASSGDATATEAATALGATVETTYKGLVQADVPVEVLQQLAASPSVSYIREPRKPTAFTTSEGVADIGANTWQAAGNNGSGVKIAVLDPGFSGYQSLVASGELPANVIVQSFSGDITGGGQIHGAACAEIVHDVAPGAQLYLVNFSTDVELGNAVDYMIAQGINVVSASWGFYGSFRGDGQGSIDDMVQRANAAGIVWANASGNAAQTHWSGHFTDANSDGWHEFAPGDIGNDVTASAGSSIDFYLTWDSWPLTNQDYDMYLVWSGNPSTPVASGDSWQNGSQPPAEEIHYTVPSGQGGTYYITINKYSATGNANFQLYSYPGSFQYQVAAGSLGGQPTDSAYAMTVGAVPFGSNSIEYFSSRGPTIDGRTKPDIVAPDRVSTSTYGVQGFWGTSAAAPHAAGAAALMKGAYPSYTPVAVQSALEARATDLGAAGKDSVYGSGRLTLGALPDHTPPLVTSVQPSGTISTASPTVAVNYLDTGSGINASSAQVTLDGSPLSGCTITTAAASCPTTGLATGIHSIGGAVADNSGNSTPISGSFTINPDCTKPLLSLGVPNSFWATYTDYLQRQLSVSFPLCNTGANDAFNIAMVGSVNTNSAILSSAVPQTVGNLGPASGTPTCTSLTVKYLVPTGVSSFRSTLYVTAEDICGASYAYPSQYIEI